MYALLAVTVVGHLYDIATHQEHWPFSAYPMYDHAQLSWTLVTPQIVGVRSDVSDGEWPLRRSADLAPFDQSRLIQALQTLQQAPDGRARLTTALVDCLARYERRRVAGKHDGPPLRALRYYQTTWELEHEPRDVDRPERRDLLLEVQLP